VKRTVLVIDDDARLCLSLADALTGPETEILTAGTLGEGLAVCRRRQVDVVLLDQQLPDGEGATACPAILSQDEGTKIVFMTAYPSFENAVAAVRHGAFDYLTKPFELEALRLTVGNALRLRALEGVEALARRRACQDEAQTRLVGEAPAMRELRHLCERAAASQAPVLIAGETGTGKTLIARYIHFRGQGAGRPFVALNCAESELFGHEKGAFTGASSPRRGVFEMAEDGTVLLDEIGTMPLALQAKLLGVLEDRRFRRVGSEVERVVSARVMAATNADLEAARTGGRFRHDLYFRLNVIRIDVPPLRAHPEDIPELCAYLLETIGGARRPLAPGEPERLAAYDWPGNVRELRNLLERTAILEPAGPLAPSRLLGGALPGPGEASAPAAPLRTLREVERSHIEVTLRQLGFNLTRTARALGISLSTLKRKVREFDVR